LIIEDEQQRNTIYKKLKEVLDIKECDEIKF